MTPPALVVIPVRDGLAPTGSLDAVAQASRLGEVRTVLVGSRPAGAVDALGAIAAPGSAVELIEAGDFAPAAWASALAPLVAESGAVVLPGSPDGRDLAARLAAVTARPLLSNVLSIASASAGPANDGVEGGGGIEFVVAHHGGRLESVVHAHARVVATVQPGLHAAVGASEPTTRVATKVLDLGIGSTSGPRFDTADPRVVAIDPPDAATMDLADATRLVGGGAGLLDRDGDDSPRRFERLKAVGEALGAAMGATRVVTDAGFVGHDRQIGTTGVVVDPDLYLAFGISGAVQHTAGLGSPAHVISVNTDPHCPMMAMSNLAIVADADATVVALARRLGVDPAPTDRPDR
ncbi:MAG: mycofactocin-associated electron transfer flavoprotein alpha subunit [Microthrixaceae bacterium]